MLTNQNSTTICLGGCYSHPAHPTNNPKHVGFILVDAVEMGFFGWDKHVQTITTFLVGLPVPNMGDRPRKRILCQQA